MRETGPRINDRIRAPEIRLIGAEGENVGVVTPARAMAMAEEAGLDLVEISPNAVPPVCKIMDFSKFKYEQQKKEAEVRQQIKQLGLLGEMPPEIRDQIYAEIGKSLPNIGSLISAGKVPAASGPANTPSTAASNSPASAESTPAG